jgi:hypothetical protein
MKTEKPKNDGTKRQKMSTTVKDDDGEWSRVSRAVASARDQTSFINALNALVIFFNSLDSSLPHLCSASGASKSAAMRQALNLFAISKKSISSQQRRVRERVDAQLSRCVECMCAAHYARFDLVSQWVRINDVAMETVNSRLRRADSARVIAALGSTSASTNVDVLIVPVVELMRYVSSLLYSSRSSLAVTDALVARLSVLRVVSGDRVDVDSPAFQRILARSDQLVPGALCLIVSRRRALAQLAQLVLAAARLPVNTSTPMAADLVHTVQPLMRRMLRIATLAVDVPLPDALDNDAGTSDSSSPSSNDAARLCVDQLTDTAAVWQAVVYVFELFDPASLAQRLTAPEIQAFVNVCGAAVRHRAVPSAAVLTVVTELVAATQGKAFESDESAAQLFVKLMARVCNEATDKTAAQLSRPIQRLSRELLTSITGYDAVRTVEQLVFETAFAQPAEPRRPVALASAFAAVAIARLEAAFSSSTTDDHPPFYCMERWATRLVERACADGDDGDAVRALGAALLYDVRAYNVRVLRRTHDFSIDHSPQLWRRATAAVARLPVAVFDAIFADHTPLLLPLLSLDTLDPVLSSFVDELAQFLDAVGTHHTPAWCAREAFAHVAASLVTEAREGLRRAALHLVIASFPPQHPLPLHRLARRSPALGEAVARGILRTCDQLIKESPEAPSPRCYALVRALPVFLRALDECRGGATTAAAFGSVWRVLLVLVDLMARRAFVVTHWTCVSSLPPEEIDFASMAHGHQYDALERFASVSKAFVARKQLDADEMRTYLIDPGAAPSSLGDGVSRLQYVLSRAVAPLVDVVVMNDRKTPSDMRDVRWRALNTLMAALTDVGRRFVSPSTRKLLRMLAFDETYKRCGSSEQRDTLIPLLGALRDGDDDDDDDDGAGDGHVASEPSSPVSAKPVAPGHSDLIASRLMSDSSSSDDEELEDDRSFTKKRPFDAVSTAQSNDSKKLPVTTNVERNVDVISLSSEVEEPEVNTEAKQLVHVEPSSVHTSDSHSDEISLISYNDDTTPESSSRRATSSSSSSDSGYDEAGLDQELLKARARHRDLLAEDGDAVRPKVQKQKAPTPKRAPPVPARPASASTAASATGRSGATDAALMRLAARQADTDSKPKASTMFVPKTKVGVRAVPTIGGAATSAQPVVTVGAVKYSLDHLRRTVLSWDARFDLSDSGASANATASRPADRFAKWTEYRDAFLPLLLIEFHASVSSDLAECDFEANTLAASVVLGSQLQKSWTLELDLAFPRAEAQELVRKNSLLLVYAMTGGGFGGPRTRPEWSDVRDHALAQVLEVKRFVKDAPRDSTIVRVCISQASRSSQEPNARRLAVMSSLLHQKGDVCVTVLSSMSTLLREFESLNEVGELDLREYLLDPARQPNKVSATPAVDDLPPALSQANRVQRDVIRNVCNLERGFVLIQGPPGTGKTRTILMLIEALLSRDKTRMRLAYEPAFACERVLVCAPSNAAVDEICMRLVAARPSPDAPMNPRRADVVRIGQCSDVVERFSLQRLADALRGDDSNADVLSQDQAARDALGILMDCIEKFVDTVVTPQIVREQQMPPMLRVTGESVTWFVRPGESIPSFDDIMATESEGGGAGGGAGGAVSLNGEPSSVVSVRDAKTKRVDYVDKPVAIEDAFEVFDTSFHPLLAAPTTARAGDKHTSATLAPHTTRITEALRLRGSWLTLRDAVMQVRGSIGRDKRTLDDRVSQARDRRDRERVELSEQREVDVLRGARVVCATLSSSAIEAMQRAKNAGVRFETVIVDEAGQAVEPSTLVPLRHNTMRCVLVGDPKQLPPTIIANSIAQLYSRSMFERLALSPHCQHFQLEVQYRMHPSIRRFPSNFFYGGTLRDGPNIVDSVGDVMPAYDIPAHHDALYCGASLLFDVQDSREARGGAMNESTSLWNQNEVDCIVAIYNDLIRQHREMLKMSFVIITPYTAQLARLRRAFTALRDVHTGGLRVLTVDAAQGSECDVVLLSCVRASGAGIGFVGDVRRINVAVTRARLLRIVVGSRVALERSNAWRGLIADAVALDGVRAVVSPFELDQLRRRRAAAAEPVVFPRRSSQIADKAQLSLSSTESEDDDDDDIAVDELEEGEWVRHSGTKRSEPSTQMSAPPPGKKATTETTTSSTSAAAAAAAAAVAAAVANTATPIVPAPRMTPAEAAASKARTLAAITARVLSGAPSQARVKLIANAATGAKKFEND